MKYYFLISCRNCKLFLVVNMKKSKPGIKPKISDDDIVNVIKDFDIFLGKEPGILKSELDEVWKNIARQLIILNSEAEINIHTLRERIRQNRNQI